MLPSKRLSYSSVSTYMGCPHQWEAKYIGIDGVKYKDPPSIYTARGIAVHAGLEAYMKTRISARLSGTLDVLSLEDAENVAREAWEAETSHPEMRWMGRSPDVIWWDVTEMLRAGIDDLATTIAAPAGAELEILVNIPDTDGWQFLAKVDLISDDDLGTGVWLYDWKTGKPWTQNQTDAAHQLTAYGWAFQQAYGQAPTGFSILSIAPPEMAVSKTKEILTKRTADHYAHWQTVLQNVVRGIESGSFWPNTQYEWCKNCPIKFECMPWV